MPDQQRVVGNLEVIGRELALGPAEHVAIGDLAGSRNAVVVEIEDALDTLDVHCQPFEPISQLGRDRIALEAANLLKIGELADFHAVEPDFPAKPPSAQS